MFSLGHPFFVPEMSILVRWHTCPYTLQPCFIHFFIYLNCWFCDVCQGDQMCGNHHPSVSQNTLGKLPKTPPVCSRPIHLSDLMCSLHLPILYVLQLLSFPKTSILPRHTILIMIRWYVYVSSVQYVRFADFVLFWCWMDSSGKTKFSAFSYCSQLSGD